jgi:ferredoxin
VSPRAEANAVDARQLTSAVKSRAGELGLSACGVAPYDPKYTFAQFEGAEAGDTVVVVALEQNYEATQTIPSVRGDKAALLAYADVMKLSSRLAEFLHDSGYRAHVHDFQGQAVVLHYAVEAGLGQMGLNGQLLTPAAGSRCRLTMITTNAPLLVDKPQDYGIHGICDRCQACVQRCPSGAIPAKRAMYRGVEKAKLNTGRCFPVVAQVHACAICMKVCPIQRYGLARVLDRYRDDGTILGKDTDELEGYEWPLDGKHYGPGEKPRLEPSFFNPPGFNFDPSRKLPQAVAEKDFT